MTNNKWQSAGSTSGSDAEQQALVWLTRQGLSLIERNYLCKTGEIDLIMREGHTIVFVEVRFRRINHYGGSLESVDRRKQQKLLRAANHFLLCRRQFSNMPCRFDVLAGSPDSSPQQSIVWSWIKNAFC